ncbi:glycine--tRNA ligase subunit beta [Streptobacillus moniliformis]|uniref:Glycine--tRNA ligase beta subunit n=1 Tax=Streptobacillus moniliformis (strain ATCC 14647 / DSM 12112 / NCTC 10651 / 9901) TaxID=519441 RepID=D1AUZ3_STRM9|nr:glycine--tRNA ligase subunit beta [Streptobacillus moniliformis]ACZ01553.1 glycyl-tRNA synthetase, beta subunit [Streptobacillus moniliformis DSM 12112]AVL43449.1 glycine--tRNA ligase subunit beta [Streptobacillus moniliformis]SQA13280.1 Glycine--tRNA ligase beta subunit [Streptobacillus moniliformis]
MRFLFEIGVEELPSRYVDKACDDLLEIFKKELIEARIEFSGEKKYNSPRRIAIYFENIAKMQKDLYEKKIGPSVQVAYKEGELTKAALGFLNSQNLTLSDLKIEKTDKGEYIYVEKNIKGIESFKVLPELMEMAIKSLDFDKTMKWSDKSFRFARPIKWIVATLDDEIIDFTFEGITASNISRGMRLFGNQEVLISDSSKYEDILLNEYVVVDTLKRREMILDSINKNCEKDGDRVIVNKYLLDEVVNLVEYPYAIKGEFNKDYLELPEDIITITMETHQRYFPVKNSEGKLTNKFVLIRNAPEYSELVKKGNEKVIEPRLADAKFFFDEDLKINLNDNVEKLKNVTFQKDMGTIFEKMERSQKIAKYLINKLNLENEEDILKTIYLSKADLVSNVINEKEFTKLQGFMGSIYAEKQGEKPEISKGIFEHYLPRFQGDILPETMEGTIASISDKLDTLVGTFSVNLIPTSSKDPYALRRATNGLLLTAFNKNLNIDYLDLINKAFEIFSEDKKILNDNAKENILDFIKQRLEAILAIDFSKNLIAYQINNVTSIMDIKNRLIKLSELEKSENFEILINLIKRLKNISKEVVENVNINLFTNEEEKELYNLSQSLSGDFNDIDMLIDKKDIINRFFEKVIINVKDEVIKNNRIALINEMLSKVNRLIQV